MNTQTFSTKIIIIGINPNVIVPPNILKSLYKQASKTNGTTPVRGRLNGKDFLANIVKYQGEYRLYLNGVMRKTAGIDVGDLANVEIEFDPKPRVEKMPSRFSQALKEDPEAKIIFEKYPPSHQKEILRYLNSLKTEKSLDRNIEKVIQHLYGQNPTGLAPLMHKKVAKFTS